MGVRSNGRMPSFRPQVSACADDDQKWSKRKLNLKPIDNKSVLSLDYDLLLNFWIEEAESSTELNLRGNAKLEFGGFIIVKDNFSPSITSKQDAMDLLSQHAEIDNVYQCHDEGFRFLIR